MTDALIATEGASASQAGGGKVFRTTLPANRQLASDYPIPWRARMLVERTTNADVFSTTITGPT